MARRRPLLRCFEVFAFLCLTVDSKDAAAPAVAESYAAANIDARGTTGGKSARLASKTSSEAPDAEGIRRRIAAMGGAASSSDGSLEIAKAPAHPDSIESEDHASWIGKFTSPADTCRLDGAPDNPSSYWGRGQDAQPGGFGGAIRGKEAKNEPRPLSPTEDELVDFDRRRDPFGQQGDDGDEQYSTRSRNESEGRKTSANEDCSGLSITDRGTNSSCEALSGLQLDHDPWEGYEIIAQADPVASWEILREARLSYYIFKYDRKKGRRQLGVLPTEIARFLPEAFSTFTLPVLLPDGSRSRVEGVPNIDWTYLFAHTLVVTQELHRRYSALNTKMDVLKAEAQNASLKLVRFLEEQGKEWQTAAILKEVASLSEMKRDIAEHKVFSRNAEGREHRRWLEQRHNLTMAIAETEVELAIDLAAEAASQGIQRLQEEERGLERFIAQEESLRMSTEMNLLLIDIEAANQTARLSCNRRLSENLATLRATKDAERVGEAIDMVRIRAKGAEARKQAQAGIDETFAFVGSLVLSALSDPVKLVRIMAAFLGIAFVGLSVGNSVTLAAIMIRRRVTKPRLIRETDLPGSLPGAAAAWFARRGRALLLTLVGKSNRCTSGLDPSSTEALEGVVLPPSVEQRLRVIATSIRSAFSRGAPLPHVLIHGAPGSGKSVLARRLAKMCGLKTVIVAGGDVGSLGRTASAEISGLVMWAGGGSVGGGGGLQRRGGGWARKSRGRGVVVVMDEAEAALGDRRKRGMSENARSALNALLLCTGELRPGFFMVLTTSRPQDLDEAVLDRVDEVLHLPRPGLAERARLIRLYFSSYLHHDPPSDFLRGPAAGGAAGCRETAGRREASVSARRKRFTTNNAHGKGGGNISGHTENNVGNGASTSVIGNNDNSNNTHEDDEDDDKMREAWPETGANITPVAVSQQPELQRDGDTENRRSVWSRVFVKKKRGCEDSGGRRGVVRMSEGFKRKAPRLMAMLAVRSEGFYGRDMAHLFSAVQAAVFGSEDCELTERLWASTERQKLKEFSEKVLLSAAAPTAPTVAALPAPVNKVRKGSATAAGPSLSPPLPRRRACKTAAPAMTEASIAFTYHDENAGKDQYEGPTIPAACGGSASSGCAFGTRFGADTAAPCRSGSVSISGNEHGGAASSLMVSLDCKSRSRFAERGQNECGAETGACDIAPCAAIPSEVDRAEPTAASASEKEEELELELESVGWVGSRGALSSPPCDPEITRPERFAD